MVRARRGGASPVRVRIVPIIKPLDEELLRASAAKTGHVVTVEEHSVHRW